MNTEKLKGYCTRVKDFFVTTKDAGVVIWNQAHKWTKVIIALLAVIAVIELVTLAIGQFITTLLILVYIFIIEGQQMVICDLSEQNSDLRAKIASKECCGSGNCSK